MPRALLATVFTGMVGNGIAYGLWFTVVRRLSAVTASLGVLGVPVIGIVISMMILGERPTAADIVGFALIFAASACVLLSHWARRLRRTRASGACDRRLRHDPLCQLRARATMALCGSVSGSITVKWLVPAISW